MKYDPGDKARAESEGCSDVSPALWQLFLKTALKKVSLLQFLPFFWDKNLLECKKVGSCTAVLFIGLLLAIMHSIMVRFSAWLYSNESSQEK